MYVLIDGDNMRALAKHPNWQRLHDYGILTCSECSIVLPLDEDSIKKEFDNVQLQLLYINTTGNTDGATYARNVVCRILVYYFNKMQETQIGENSDSQANWAIGEDRQGSCLYSPTGDRPIVHDGEAPYFQSLPDHSGEAAIEAGAPVQVTPGTQPAWRPGRDTSAATAQSSGERSTAPRASGTRDVIFEVADAMWEAAGKPTDKSEILKLRKEMMNTLEAQGVKRNTSSNTLGSWQKERIG